MRVKSIAFITPNAASLHGFKGELIAELVSRGVKVFALASDFDDVSRAAVAACGAEPVDVEVTRSSLSPASAAADVIRLARIIRVLQPDAVLSYFVQSVVIGTLAARLAGVRRRVSSVEGLGFYFSHIGPSSARYRIIKQTLLQGMRLAVRMSHRVIFLNEDDRAMLMPAGRSPAGKVVRLPGIGLDLDHFTPSCAVPPQPTFVLVARLLWQKGIGEFADAATLVRSRYPNARFLLVGGRDNAPGALTEAEVAELQSNSPLEVTGHVKDVRQHLAHATAFVLPSYREGASRSIQEAMAMGLPVITTDVPGCRDLIDEGLNGFLIPPRDPEALADAITRFIVYPELRQMMGHQSRVAAEREFDAAAINTRIIAALEAL